MDGLYEESEDYLFTEAEVPGGLCSGPLFRIYTRTSDMSRHLQALSPNNGCQYVFVLGLAPYTTQAQIDAWIRSITCFNKLLSLGWPKTVLCSMTYYGYNQYCGRTKPWVDPIPLAEAGGLVEDPAVAAAVAIGLVFGTLFLANHFLRRRK